MNQSPFANFQKGLMCLISIKLWIKIIDVHNLPLWLGKSLLTLQTVLYNPAKMFAISSHLRMHQKYEIMYSNLLIQIYINFIEWLGM